MQTVVETVTVLPLLISHQENPEYATIGVFGCIETLLHISIPLPVMLHIVISWQKIQQQKSLVSLSVPEFQQAQHKSYLPRVSVFNYDAFSKNRTS